MKKFFIITSFLLLCLLTSCVKKNMYDLAINKVVEITCENDITKSYATGTLISNDGFYAKELEYIYHRGYVWSVGAPAYTRVSRY